MYNVKILKDSINPTDDRLTTFELTYPRFVHAELMTHRLFSRNSASSRAIPTPKLVQRIRDEPVMPKWWGKNQKGMQAKAELEDEELYKVMEDWLNARDAALFWAERLREGGLHKQIANRIIEPWMFITVIVSATEYENWFYLRDSEFAQPEIAWVAREMRKQYDRNRPVPRSNGSGLEGWHLPLVNLDDPADPLFVSQDDAQSLADVRQCPMYKIFVMISAARCARVSYLTHDGQRDLVKDLELHDKLSTNGHWSPFEHVAKAWPSSKRFGNFIGWKQYRKFFPTEHHGRTLER